jgi:hypothetical protein
MSILAAVFVCAGLSILALVAFQLLIRSNFHR